MRNPFQIPALCLMTATSLFAYAPTSFVTAGQLAESRANICSAVLKDGRVLMAGGQRLGTPIYTEDGFQSITLSDAVILSPTSGQSRPAKNGMTTPRFGHTMVTLQDGKVLVLGGMFGNFGWGHSSMVEYHNSAELFDPLTETWEIVGSMNTLGGPGLESILLKNGQVLVVGSDSAEIYTPNTKSFTNVGNLIHKRDNAKLNLLPNGDVLITGASNQQNVPAEIFRVSNQQFDLTGTPRSLRRGAYTTTTLKDGRVLITGGTRARWSEIYNPATGEFQHLGLVQMYHESHTATLLADGRVALSGGLASGQVTGKVEIIDPKTATSMLTQPMRNARIGHGAVLTPRGYLMVFGGHKTQYDANGDPSAYKHANAIEVLMPYSPLPVAIDSDTTR